MTHPKAHPEAARAEQPVLVAHGISKSFGAISALSDAHIDVAGGEIMAIVGDNGAGKSTLMKVLAGALVPDTGTLVLDGVEQSFKRPLDALAAGVETVYQDLALVDTLKAYQNVFVGREMVAKSRILRAFNLLDDRSMRRRTAEVLEELRVQVPSVNASVKQMSGGQRQCLAIARAVLWGRRVVLLDEPTAALGVKESQQVMELVSRLAERGVSVVIVTHNMEQLKGLADRVTVMRLGRSIAVREVRTTAIEEVVGLITGAISPN